VKVRVKVTERDFGYNRLLASLFDGVQRIAVGLHAEDGAKIYEDPRHLGGARQTEYTIGQIAQFNEFGLGVPERSWCRAWFEANKTKCVGIIHAKLKQVAHGDRDGAQVVLKQAAREILQSMIQNIESGTAFVPNASFTIEKKGSAIPLIDTGQLLKSLKASLNGQKITE